MTEGKYVITNGTQFVYRNWKGKYKTSTSYAGAEKFATIEDALSLINNVLPYHIKRDFYVGSYYGEKLIEHKRAHVKGSESVKKDVSTKQGYHLNGCTDNLDGWFRLIEDLKWMIERIEHNKKELYKEISRIDLVLTDLRHSYLHQNIDACKRCKRDVVVQEYERKRQELKNETELMDVCADIDLQKIQSLIDAAGIIQNKVYKPREADDLYETGIDKMYRQIKEGKI